MGCVSPPAYPWNENARDMVASCDGVCRAMASISAGALLDGVNRGTCNVSRGAETAATWEAAAAPEGCDNVCSGCDSSCSVLFICSRGACAATEGSPSCRDACVSRCDQRQRVERGRAKNKPAADGSAVPRYLVWARCPSYPRLAKPLRECMGMGCVCRRVDRVELN